MKDQTRRIDRWMQEVKSKMHLDAIWNDEYEAVLAEEIAVEVRQEARAQAEADIHERRNRLNRVSK